MHTLTRKQSAQINNAQHTHNYSAAAIAQYNATQQCVLNEYTQLFEQQTNVLATATAQDIGGLIVYFNNNNELVAFYDYENFVGTVFIAAAVAA